MTHILNILSARCILSPIIRSSLVQHGLRRASASSTGKGSKLEPGSIKILTNPGDKYLTSYMEGIGRYRTNFKESDYKIWRKAYNEKDFYMDFYCTKDTDTVIGSLLFLRLRALPTHNNLNVLYTGFLYIDEKYRGTDMGKIISKELLDHQQIEDDNAITFSKPKSLKIWKHVFKSEMLGHELYESFYNREEVRIPSPELKFDDILIKSAHDVSDDDITKYDQSIVPFDRVQYMLTHLRDPDGFGKVAYDLKGNVIGFGTTTIYPSGDCTLFPFYADNERIAQAIFQECLKDIEKSGRKVTRFEMRSVDNKDGYEDNYKWIQPFLTVPAKKEYLAVITYNKKRLEGLNFKKVFVTAITTNNFL